MPESRFWRRYRLIAAVAAAAVLAWSYRVLAAWTDRPTIFLFAFAALFGLLLLIDWVFDLIGPPLWRLLRSLGVSIGRAVEHDPEVDAVLDRRPDLRDWLRARLTLRRWTGWYLSATVLLALFFLAGFASIAEGVLERGDLAVYDVGIAALLRAFRTPGATRVFWIATVFGDPRVMWVVAVVFVLLLLLWGRRGEAVLVAVTMSVGSAVGSLVKIVVARPRPPAAFALISTPGSNSFPSGHALSSLLFFTLLAFVLLRSPVACTARRRFAVVVLCALGAFTVALSRVYLGVHWPTDLLGSWFLAAAWATVAIGTFRMWERYAQGRKRWPPVASRKVRIGVTVLVAVLVVATVVVGAEADPLLRKLVAPPPPVAFGPAQLPSAEAALPKFTENLDGSAEEPISLVFVGTEAQLVEAFERAGWQVADHQSLTALLHVSLAALANRPYPTAPVTPAFVEGKANDIAFEKPQGTPTARRRHHARFWLTGVTLDGKPVWVGTASFDMRLEIGTAIPFPTHHIAPDIDAERELLVKQLTATGLVDEVGKFRVTRPESGTNAAGDKFFTDGTADVLLAR